MNSLARAVEYLNTHQIDCGMSFGIFDLEYKFRRPESAASGGTLYWVPDDGVTDGSKLLKQMDFPLFTIALAYDAINELDKTQMKSAVAPTDGRLVSRAREGCQA